MIIKIVKWWKGEYVKSPSHSSNPIDFSNIFILIKRTIYDMQIHDLVERSSTFIHVFRAQSISHSGHFLLYKINQFPCNSGAMIESLRLKYYSQKWWLFVSHLNIRSFEKYVFFMLYNVNNSFSHVAACSLHVLTGTNFGMT